MEADNYFNDKSKASINTTEKKEIVNHSLIFTKKTIWTENNSMLDNRSLRPYGTEHGSWARVQDFCKLSSNGVYNVTRLKPSRYR